MLKTEGDSVSGHPAARSPGRPGDATEVLA
jgi:hypothetical protein